MALARDEVADGRDRRQLGLGRGLGRDVGAEAHDTRVPRAELLRPLLRAGGVGEHEPGLGERARHRRAAAVRWTTESTSPPWTEITTGVPGRARRTASPAGAA